MDDATVTTREPGQRKQRRPLRIVLSIAIAVALLVGVLPQLADFGEVWAAISSMTLLEVLGLAAVSAWNISTYLFVMMAALPGLGYWKAFMAGQISTAVSNTVPAGSVLGVGVTYTVLSSFGHSATSIAIASAVSGIWNTFAKLTFPIAALAILAIEGQANAALLSAALTGVGILVATIVVGGFALANEGIARRTGDRVGRWVAASLRPFRRGSVTGWGEKLARFQRESIGLLRRRWHRLTIATILSHLSLFFVLLVALRHLDVAPGQVTWAEALGAFAFVRLATALPVTPGGLGIVEVGMTAALVLAGGLESAVVAAVLVYRVLTYGLQVPLGMASYAVWQRQLRRPGATGG